MPVTPLLDVVGKADNTAPEQMGGTGENDGVMTGVIVTWKV